MRWRFGQAYDYNVGKEVSGHIPAVCGPIDIFPFSDSISSGAWQGGSFGAVQGFAPGNGCGWPKCAQLKYTQHALHCTGSRVPPHSTSLARPSKFWQVLRSPAGLPPSLQRLTDITIAAACLRFAGCCFDIIEVQFMPVVPAGPVFGVDALVDPAVE